MIYIFMSFKERVKPDGLKFSSTSIIFKPRIVGVKQASLKSLIMNVLERITP